MFITFFIILNILETSFNVQCFFNELYIIYQLSEIKDDIHVVFQLPMFIVTP